MTKTRLTLTLLATAALALSACKKDGPAAASSSSAADDATVATVVAPGDKSLPDALDDASNLQTVAEGLKDTGIAQALRGKGSYTLLAPGDDTFDKLGDQRPALIEGMHHAALAALLKAHMLPGYITPKDILAAIAASQDGQVTMPNMAGQALVFSRVNGTIEVTAPDGSQVTLDGDPIAGGASIALPVDGLLKKVGP